MSGPATVTTHCQGSIGYLLNLPLQAGQSVKELRNVAEGLQIFSDSWEGVNK